MFEDEGITFLRNHVHIKPATSYHIPEEPNLGHVWSLVCQKAVINSQYYGDNFVERKFLMTEESISSNSIKFVITKRTYQNSRNVLIMELLLKKKQIPGNFMLELNDSCILRNTECHLS